MAFPNSMNMTQAPAVEGQIASLNPRHAAPGAAGAFTAGSGGVTVARFAWSDAAGSVLLNSASSGTPSGFVANEFGEAIITTYLAESGMVIPYGQPVPCFYTAGDFWVKNTNASAATVIGNKAYAKLTDGTIQFYATGQTVAGYVETKWYAATVGAAGELVKMTNVSFD